LVTRPTPHIQEGEGKEMNAAVVVVALVPPPPPPHLPAILRVRESFGHKDEVTILQIIRPILFIQAIMITQINDKTHFSPQDPLVIKEGGECEFPGGVTIMTGEVTLLYFIFIYLFIYFFGGGGGGGKEVKGKRKSEHR